MGDSRSQGFTQVSVPVGYERFMLRQLFEYAEKRDGPALLGYCASSEVANVVVRDMPPYIFALELKVTSEGDGKERVELGYDPVFAFEVERLTDGWRVVSFGAS